MQKPSKYEMGADVLESLQNADSHIVNMENPHGVTIAQIGAASASDVENYQMDLDSYLKQNNTQSQTDLLKDTFPLANTTTNTKLMKLGLKGRSVINILGTDGDMEAIWNTYLTSISLDASNKVFGNNSIKVVLTSAGGGAYRDIKSKIDVTKYYCLSGYLKNGNLATGCYLRAVGTGTGAIGVNSTYVTDTSQFVRKFIKISPAAWGTSPTNCYIYAYASGAVDQYAYADGFMLNEITEAEYNDVNYEPPEYVNNNVDVVNPVVKTTDGTNETSLTISYILRDCSGIKDEITQDGKFVQRVGYKVLDGTCSWIFHDSTTGLKSVKILNFVTDNNVDGYDWVTHNKAKMLKYNGNILSPGDSSSVADVYTYWDGYLAISIPNSESGWGDSYTPTADEIKAYFNGWRLTGLDWVDYSSGTKYWSKVTDPRGGATPYYTTMPTTMADGFTPYRMYFQLAVPVITDVGLKTLPCYPNSSLVCESEILPLINFTMMDNVKTNVDNLVEVSSKALLKAQEAFQSANDGMNDAATRISTAITAKGVLASPTDAFSLLATKIGQISTGLKFQTGTIASSSGTSNYITQSGGTTPRYSVDVTTLDFTPDFVVISWTTLGTVIFDVNYDFNPGFTYPCPIKLINTSGSVVTIANQSPVVITSGRFKLPFTAGDTVVAWWAFGH